MKVVVKLVQFKDFDFQKVVDFLNSHEGCQVLNASFFVGEKQVLHAVNEMKKAFENGCNFASSEELEFLVRFLGERQIKRAVEKAKPGVRSLFVSWKGVRNYRDFEEEFEFKVLKFPRVKEKELKAAMEKTAAFWI